jgi:hypothetical protein
MYVSVFVEIHNINETVIDLRQGKKLNYITIPQTTNGRIEGMCQLGHS